MIITIDGKCCLGKSTVARLVAQKIGFEVLSSGVMIRYIAFLLHRRGSEQNIQSSLDSIIKLLNIDDALSLKSDVLRNPELTCYFHYITQEPYLSFLYKHLQEYCMGKDIIVDGRDTFDILPDASLSYYFVASVERRADVFATSHGVSFEEGLLYILTRDKEERQISIPRDRVIIINSLKDSVKAVVNRIITDYDLLTLNNNNKQ